MPVSAETSMTASKVAALWRIGLSPVARPPASGGLGALAGQSRRKERPQMRVLVVQGASAVQGYDSTTVALAPVALSASTMEAIVRGMNWLESPTTVRASVAPNVAALKAPDALSKVV